MLDEDVDAESVGKIIRGIHAMESKSKELPITVMISSYGGSCYDGLGLYDVMRASPCEIRTVAIGKVMSMGTWLMLAGDVRQSYHNTTFMWHSIASEMEHQKLFALKTDNKETDRLYDRLLDIYCDRSAVKDKSFWRKWIQYEDRYGDAEKALEMGFIDSIIE